MKPKFTKAIVRIPCINMVHGLTQAAMGVPDYHKAIHQHNEYIKALKECGLGILILPADENFPDSTFVEDTALLTPEVAIITNPGAVSRKGEKNEIRKVIESFYKKVKTIQMKKLLTKFFITTIVNAYHCTLITYQEFLVNVLVLNISSKIPSLFLTSDL